MLRRLHQLIAKRNQLYNQNMISGFVFNSLPKAGTNLVCKAIDSIPGICRSKGADVRAADGLEYDQEEMIKIKSVPVGIVTPLLCPYSRVEKKFSLIKKGQYSAWHIPFNQEIKRLFNNKIKLILSMRDHRDVIVSQYFYAMKNKGHLLHDMYKDKDMYSCLDLAINGIKPEDYDGRYHTPIADRLEQIILWINNYNSHLVRFEELIGPKGGGSTKDQIQAFRKLCKYLGVKCSKYVSSSILEGLYGGTHTFRKGISGDWKNHFSKRNKNNFKESAGDMLIELRYEQDKNW